MPRLIRRRPFVERVKAHLNPLDLLLWLSEGFDASDLDQWQKSWSTTIGICFNVIFLLARANAGSRSQHLVDDVFGDQRASTGLISWLAAFTVHMLTLLSIMNAVYTFHRRRHYRLFESSGDAAPATPSAHRVRVDSSPLASSPLRFLSRILVADGAESGPHSHDTRDVWELAVWDPAPLSLRLFCLFSPGHVLVYWLFLPTAVTDPRPSITVVITLGLAALLSAQLLLLQSSFSQQAKDSTVVHKEVLHEYNTKFVHPRTQPLTRDVGTQFSLSSTSDERGTAFVETHTPTYVINRGFRTRPNPNYARYVDPTGPQATPSRNAFNETTPIMNGSTAFQDISSPLRPATAIRQQQQQQKPNGVLRASDGGNLGVLSHAYSPLRKTASAQFGDRQYRARGHSPTKGEGSPLKRSSLAPGAASEQRTGPVQHSSYRQGRVRV
ncbi:MAG: hypothetical protein Q9222_001813 [Ikaeria aurantiellina]